MNGSTVQSRREFIKLSAASAISAAVASSYPAGAAGLSPIGKRPFQLKEVDEVRITTLLDNYTDLLVPSTPVAQRPPMTPDVFFRPMLRGEHGFAALVTVRNDEGYRRVLLDTGSSETGILHNADRLEIDLSGLDAIVISHNHADHTLGTARLMGRLGQRWVCFVAHPYAFLEHRFTTPGFVVAMPPLRREILQDANIDLIETAEPTLLEGNSLLVTGEVARTTSFETGMPNQQVKVDGRWQAEPLVRDDQSVAVHLGGKGLVIITGCAHAGIVNTVRYIQVITGIEQVYAIVGGLHLQNPAAIAPTVAAIKAMSPRWVIPTHCTGFGGILEFARSMPEAFVQNAVGTTIVL